MGVCLTDLPPQNELPSAAPEKDSEFEFQIKSPKEVAQLWGQVTNNPSMNHEKLVIGLRFYFTKGIMGKVPGKRLTFRYAGSIRNYVQMRWSQMVSSHEEIVASSGVNSHVTIV